MPSALANGAQTATQLSRSPIRPRANSAGLEIHSAALQRRGIDRTARDQMGPASDRRLLAEGRQASGNFASSGQFF